jgi:SAM-dependent methyltransferase
LIGGRISNECSKAVARRSRDPEFANRYLVGRGIDVGAGADGIGTHHDVFPRMGKIRHWDMDDGDGQVLAGIPDCEFDFVHSSHSLEHMADPVAAMRRWLDVTVFGGHVIVLVPDEDMYEQGVWPSTFNPDHKWTFTAWKRASWSPQSINVIDLVRLLGQDAELVRLEVLYGTFDYQPGRRHDQTLGDAESAIEFVVRRRHPRELERGGMLP